MLQKYLTAAVFIILLILQSTHYTNAQENLRDYAIDDVTWMIFDEDNILQIEVLIINNGTDATQETEAVFLLISSNSELARVTIPALTEDATVTVHGRFSLNDFPASTTQTIQVSVGIDSFEPLNTPIADDNLRTITIDIPARATPTQATPAQNNSALPLDIEQAGSILAVTAILVLAIMVFIYAYFILRPAIVSKGKIFTKNSKSFRVFISYRRNPTWGQARAIANDLEARGADVFLMSIVSMKVIFLL